MTDRAQQDLLAELDRFTTEQRNPRTLDIDLMDSLGIVTAMNAEDRLVPEAVAAVLPQVARAVDAIVDAFGKGGRLIYIGAGSSGRLGVLDASECPPTYGVSPGMVIGLIAGGDAALRSAIEGAEDDAEAGAQALDGAGLTANDVVVGIAASGRTPYVLGALTRAKAIGAVTVGLTTNPGSPLTEAAGIAIVPVVGPEALTGSTRLKSGTAQKMVLNMLTTASMIRIGKSYGNLMVDVMATNEKLVARAVRIVMLATECSAETAREALARAGNEVKPAILSILTGLAPDAARTSLARAGGVLRRALGSPSA